MGMEVFRNRDDDYAEWRAAHPDGRPRNNIRGTYWSQWWPTASWPTPPTPYAVGS
jgi:hypothetical protein